MEKEKNTKKTTVSFQIDKDLYDQFKRLLFLVEGQEKVTTWITAQIKTYVESKKEISDALNKAIKQ